MRQTLYDDLKFSFGFFLAVSIAIHDNPSYCASNWIVTNPFGMGAMARSMIRPYLDDLFCTS